MKNPNCRLCGQPIKSPCVVHGIVVKDLCFGCAIDARNEYEYERDNNPDFDDADNADPEEP